MTSQVRMDEGKALSDVESDPEPAPSRKAAAKDKETPAQRAEQRRTRKREKVRLGRTSKLCSGRVGRHLDANQILLPDDLCMVLGDDRTA